MRRRIEEKEVSPIRARDVLLDLWHARPALARLKERSNIYDPLLDVLLAIGEDDPIPQSRELQTRFNLTPAKFRKWLDSLHEDFLIAISEDAAMLPIREVKSVFLVYGDRDSVAVACHLPVLPRVGETVRIPFIKSVAGSDTFYIEEISYELAGPVLEVFIRLKPGSYNQHYEYLKDRARFENELDSIKERTMNDYQLRRFIGDLYH